MADLTVVALMIMLFGVMTAIMKCESLPESISAMVYELPKNRQWMWSVWLCAIAGLLFYPLMLALTDQCVGAESLGWITITCLIGTAVTPIIQDHTRRWHNILGIIAGIVSQVCVLLINPWWLLIWIVLIMLLGNSFVSRSTSAWYDGKGLFIIEVLCSISMMGALMIY